MAVAGWCRVSLVAAFIFTMRGAWYIQGFAILELTAVGLAFLQYGRHATGREHIALIGNKLLMEPSRADRSQQDMLGARRAPWRRRSQASVRLPSKRAAFESWWGDIPRHENGKVRIRARPRCGKRA
jgi:hypothetical protein